MISGGLGVAEIAEKIGGNNEKIGENCKGNMRKLQRKYEKIAKKIGGNSEENRRK